PLVHDVLVAVEVIDAVAGRRDQVAVPGLDGGAGAPAVLALAVDEEHLADGPRQVDVLHLAGGALLTAGGVDLSGLAVVDATAVHVAADQLGDVLGVPVVLLGLLQRRAVGV